MHTEGKWEVEKSENKIFIIVDQNQLSVIAKMDFFNDNREEDAKRIVQAVNSFDDLLEACKGALEQFNNLETMADDDTTYLSTAQRAELEQAIAQAEKPE